MAGQNPGSPTDFQYFYEDEVYKINNRGQVVFGLVLENFEANSSDQESDVETAIQKGEIRVVWHPSGNERVISEKTVGLADRSLMPGDVVRRLIAGKDTQRGYCRDIIMTADLQIVGTNHIIPGVASERLHPLEEFTPDLAVCLDSWVGTSKSVHCKLHLAAADGSRLVYPDLDTCPLQDYTMRRRRSSPYASEYYPGQVISGPLCALEHANWTNITKEMKAARRHEKKMLDHKFTVEAVVTDSVAVHWQCRALSTSNTDSQQPRYNVEGEDLKRLKLLNVFEPCTLQVGDRNYLNITETDIFIPKRQWRKQQSKNHRTLRRQTHPRKTNKDCVNHTTQPATGDLPPPKHVPSKPKKRASSFHNRESKMCPAHSENKTVPIKQSETKTSPEKKLSKEEDNSNQDMDVDAVHQPIVMQDLEMKEVLVKERDCPSINIVPSDEITVKGHFAKFGSGNSTSDDITIEEKNDSGISPEPTKEDSSSIINGNCHSTEPSSKVQEDMSEHWENTSSDEGTDTDSGATWSSRYSSANSLASGGASGPRSGKRSPQLAIKFLRGKRLKRAAKRAPAPPPPMPGARVVVETLYTTSKANVVWQDGTIEENIPSTHLYPIHHLDGQECFPGDFVISGAASDETGAKVSHREYGVVQKVDHHGRTAIVKWYKTYTCSDEPLPIILREAEVSVYDLKDHPDFQYRPGTVVIRVANFSGADAACTAGQVIDNFPEGRVKVWWVDGHTSMCWPQDLYKVGEYDSEEGELWGEDGDASESSWETQSEGPGSRDELNPSTPSPDADADDNIATGYPNPPPAQDVRVFLSSLSKAVNGLENNLERMVGELATSAASLPVCTALKELEGQIMRMGSGDLDTTADTNAEPDHLRADTLAPIPQLLEPRVASHIERGRRAMQKLQEMFAKNPKLQSRETMCKLLNLYKGCRFLDRLMGTTFFHEDHFLGLVERVRSRGGSVPTAGERRVHDQVTRLFATKEEVENKEPKSLRASDSKTGPWVLLQDCLKYKELMETTQEHMDVDEKETSKDVTQDKEKDLFTDVTSSTPADQEFPHSSMTTELDTCVQGPSLKENTDKTALTEVIEAIVDYESRKTSDEVMASSGAATRSGVTVRNVCYELCSLIHTQLVKAHAEVSKRKPQLWAQFLNKTMTEQNKDGQKLTYHFSVQYGSLVVSIADELKDKKSDSSTEMEEFEDAEDCQPNLDTAGQEANDAVAQSDAAPKETEPVLFDTDIFKTETTKQDTKEPETVESEITKNVAVASEAGEGFAMLESAPTAHRFRASILPPSEPRVFSQAIQREIKLLKKDLPAMVWVRGYEDRMDLLSLMVGGPTHTPYEDGLFLFDVQLGGEFPRAPPLCHYVSYCSDRLNPNLYEDGKVCVSLLGTWSGRGVEVWGKDSSLLQVIVSLQGLILNAEPYFNEAGYEKQKGSQQGRENSRMYNEMVVLKLVQSMTKLVLNPPEVFREEIMLHLKHHAPAMCSRLQKWMLMSEHYSNAQTPIQSKTTQNNEKDTVADASEIITPAQTNENAINATNQEMSDSNEINMVIVPPEFPLIPASRGFCLTLKSSLDAFRNALKNCGVVGTEPL